MKIVIPRLEVESTLIHQQRHVVAGGLAREQGEGFHWIEWLPGAAGNRRLDRTQRPEEWVTRAGSLETLHKVFRHIEVNPALFNQFRARPVAESVSDHGGHLFLRKRFLLRTCG